MNIYLQELRMSVRSAIYWTIGMLLILLFFMLLFPAISKDAAIMQQIIDKFPPALVSAFGLNVFDFSSVTGYYGFLFMYVSLIGSIYALKSAISALSEEVRAKTTDFLVAKPVSRTTIVTAKLASVLTNLFAQNIIYVIAAFTIVKLIADRPFDQGVFFLVNFSLILTQLFFVALGLFISVIIRKIKIVLPIALGVVFGLYVIQMLNQSLVNSKLAYLTPFAYFDTSKIVKTASYETNFVIANCIIILVFSALAYIIYNKKDMPSV